MTKNDVIWTRAKACSGGNCVDAARVGDEVWIRDSKDPAGPILQFTMDEWRAFTAGVLTGEFNYGGADVPASV